MSRIRQLVRLNTAIALLSVPLCLALTPASAQLGEKPQAPAAAPPAAAPPTAAPPAAAPRPAAAPSTAAPPTATPSNAPSAAPRSATPPSSPLGRSGEGARPPAQTQPVPAPGRVQMPRERAPNASRMPAPTAQTPYRNPSVNMQVRTGPRGYHQRPGRSYRYGMRPHMRPYRYVETRCVIRKRLVRTAFGPRWVKRRICFH
jgi:outer membrane biosynthesis protein TonB